MFDVRYHALSLAAVLFALAVGVLLGVAIGDSNLVSSAQDGIVRNLRSDLAAAQNRRATLLQEKQLEQKALTDLYQTAVHGTLAARKLGLVFLGSPSETVNGLVHEALKQAGGQLASVVTVREPLDLASLAGAATGTPYSALTKEPNLVGRFGFRMGAQLIGGGQLLSHVQTLLLSSSDGQFGNLDGIVLERADPQGMTPQQAGALSEFQAGLIRGISTLGIQTVGVELSSTSPSQVQWYKSQGISSVDDLEKVAGRAALAFALAGHRGAWGEKPSADGVLPRPTATTVP